MKRKIRLTQTGLRKVISESIKRILREWDGGYPEHAESLDEHSRMALNMCRQIYPILKQIRREGQLNSFLERVFTLNSGHILNESERTIISRLTAITMPKSGNDKEDFVRLSDALAGWTGSALSSGISRNPIVVCDKVRPDMVVGVKPWLITLYNALGRGEQSNIHDGPYKYSGGGASW